MSVVREKRAVGSMDVMQCHYLSLYLFSPPNIQYLQYSIFIFTFLDF